ncbi:MFS transporter [Phaeocystidibacter luteus]|uniref:MFS transporter n=1 Tax=Phaeocystidibacter luteus TaxID=911197 RepID=A0A6N6RMK8_9FLAO|nr:MFS transporter [Phaeocystidibacter luteus]KAB2814803.1 MFS transporter [Phaeocystidibacter luteus]
MFKNKGILIIILTVFVDLIGVGLIIPILPVYAENQLELSESLIGIIIGIFSLMQFLFAPLLGGLSDRIGRRPVIVITATITGISYLVFSQATTLLLLLVARGLGGIGGANIGVAQAYISDVVAPENRKRAFAYIGAAFGLGFVIGPFLGGVIYESLGFSWVGYIAAGISFANVLLAWRFLKEPENVKRDVNRPLFKNPIMEIIRASRTRAIGGLMLITFVFMSAFAMMQAMAALLWENIYNLTEKEVGYMFAFIGSVAFIIQGGFIGWFQKRLSDKRLLVYGIILVGVGLSGLSLVPEEYFIPYEFFFIICMSLGMAFFTPTMSSLLSTLSSSSEQGTILSVNQGVSSLARVVGPFVGGLLYEIHYQTPFVSGGITMAFIALATFFFLSGVKEKSHAE